VQNVRKERSVSVAVITAAVTTALHVTTWVARVSVLLGGEVCRVTGHVHVDTTVGSAD